MDRVKVNLTKEKETLLITLYAKALESRDANSILEDRLADALVARIDTDFSRFNLRRDHLVGLALRAKIFDDLTKSFLSAHPGATVLNLACGLDTRVYRVDPPADVAWFDVDYPDVIELRRQLLPARPDSHLIMSSVIAEAWLEQVPADRPALILAEGLTPYLTEDDGVALLRRLTRHFRTGEIVFDGYSRLGLWFIRSSSVVKATGATVHWAIEDPLALERLVPGLKLVAVQSTYDSKVAPRYSPLTRVLLVAWNFIPALRRIGRILRYRF